MYRLFLEYKNKNILMMQGFRSQIILNFSTFNKVIKHSCLINELQYRIFGCIIPNVEGSFEQQERCSPFAQLPDKQLMKIENIAGALTTADYLITDK